MSAEEFYNQNKVFISMDISVVDDKSFTKQIMIEFAKYHVEQALEKAYENADLEYYGDEVCYNKESILNSYPLENIK